MKYTIEGFSQEYAQSLKKEVIINGKDGKQKTKTIRIDCTDLVILRWFVDFYPNMRKFVIDGCEYAWLSHNKLKEDLPILDISKRACIDRMQKLVDFGILKYKLIKEGGTFSLYTFGENYEKLIDTKGTRGAVNQHRGMQSNDIGGVRSNDIGVCSQTTTKDISIKDTSIKDPSTKDTYRQVVDLFNATCISFPKVTTLSERRKKSIHARLNTYSFDDFKKCFEMAEQSDFLKGKNNRDWQANFDWMIKDANMAKILDGNYNKPAHTSAKKDGSKYCIRENKPDDMKPVDYRDFLHDGKFDKNGYNAACAKYKAWADSTRK